MLVIIFSLFVRTRPNHCDAQNVVGKWTCWYKHKSNRSSGNKVAVVLLDIEDQEAQSIDGKLKSLIINKCEECLEAMVNS